MSDTEQEHVDLSEGGVLEFCMNTGETVNIKGDGPRGLIMLTRFDDNHEHINSYHIKKREITNNQICIIVENGARNVYPDYCPQNRQSMQIELWK